MSDSVFAMPIATTTSGPGELIIQAKRSIRLLRGSVSLSSERVFDFWGMDMSSWALSRIRVHTLKKLQEILGKLSALDKTDPKKVRELMPLVAEVIKSVQVFLRSDTMFDFDNRMGNDLRKEYEQILDQYEDLWDDLYLISDAKEVKKLKASKEKMIRGESISHEEFWAGLNVPA